MIRWLIAVLLDFLFGEAQDFKYKRTTIHPS